MKIDEILSKPIRYEKSDRDNLPFHELITPQIFEKYAFRKERIKSRVYEFELKVLLYFFEKKSEVGIQNIYRLKNSRVDGLIKLDNGDVALLETKSALLGIAQGEGFVG